MPATIFTADTGLPVINILVGLAALAVLFSFGRRAVTRTIGAMLGGQATALFSGRIIVPLIGVAVGAVALPDFHGVTSSIITDYAA